MSKSIWFILSHKIDLNIETVEFSFDSPPPFKNNNNNNSNNNNNNNNEC